MYRIVCETQRVGRDNVYYCEKRCGMGQEAVVRWLGGSSGNSHDGVQELEKVGRQRDGKR